MKAIRQASSPPPTSHAERGSRQLAALCRASDLVTREGEVIELFRELTNPWGARPLEAKPSFPSDVCDDHTPYEFSLVYGEGGPELRLLVEPLGDPPSMESNWLAGKATTARLAAKYALSLDRLRKVEELFAPGPSSTLGIWHAACFWKDHGPEFKIYFDAQAQGLGRAAALLEEALHRLGFDKAWSRITSATPRGFELDELKYLSLDLAPTADARVKLYVRHRHATLADMERVLSTTGTMPGGEASAFCRAITGGDGPFDARPLFTCTTLVSRDELRPARRTLYVPVSAYARDDVEAQARIRAYLARHGLQVESYEASIAAFASRPLADGVGMHTYVSLRIEDGKRRVTSYLAPESYAVTEPQDKGSGSHPLFRPRSALGAEEIVRRYQEDMVLADHPFFRRLGREPVNLSRLWLVMANFWEAIVHDFPTKLSRAIANIEHDPIRSIMVKQLNDELGEGDFSRAHKAMFKRLLAALEPRRMPGDEQKLLAPGRQFGRRLGAHMLSADMWEAVGALMMVEIYGSQTDTRLGEEFRRQQQLDPKSMEWLNLHEGLEVDHAGDSLKLAHLVPTDDRAALESAWRGAAGVVAASQEYFDGLYQICFA